jgi:predicted nucleotidyltransferase
LIETWITFYLSLQNTRKKVESRVRNMKKNYTIPKDQIAEFCRQHHIRRLAVFGSALRDDFTEQSDIDILVEFEKGYEPGFAFFAMQDELSQLIGRQVDLNTPNFLSRYFRDTVVNSAEVIYGQS